jgi:hypothetical protein
VQFLSRDSMAWAWPAYTGVQLPLGWCMTLTAICSDHSGRAGRWSEDVPRARWLLAAPMLMPMA